MDRKLDINGDVHNIINAEHVTIYMKDGYGEFNNTNTNERSLLKCSHFRKFTCKSLFLDYYFSIEELDSCFKNEPDYLVKYKAKEKEFFLKCKFRTYLYRGFYDWARDDQLTSFREFEEEFNKPVYFAFGLGGCANNPDNVYLVPLHQIQCKLTKKQLEKWRINNIKDVFDILEGKK